MDKPTITLRRSRHRDVSAVAAIWRAAWLDGHFRLVPPELEKARTPGSFDSRAAGRVGATTVATVEKTIVGFVMVAGDEIEELYVAAEHRGTGVAQELIREAGRQLKERGYASAWLAVVAGNARARRFYERNGWRDDGPIAYPADTDHGTIEIPCHRYTKQL
jgi:GNAT superfamily N-acetyltransferase